MQLSNLGVTVDHMAKCPDCQREMRLAPSCVADFAVVVGDKTFDRIRHPTAAAARCDACGVKPGGVSPLRVRHGTMPELRRSAHHVCGLKGYWLPASLSQGSATTRGPAR